MTDPDEFGAEEDQTWGLEGPDDSMSSMVDEILAGFPVAPEGSEGVAKAPRLDRARSLSAGIKVNSIERKVGQPGTTSAKEALVAVDLVVREALGWPSDDVGKGPYLGELADRLDRLMARLGIPDDGSVLPKHPGGKSTLNSPTRHVGLRFVAVPTVWYGHAARARGKGATRSARAYLEALHILAYIVHMYRRPGRFDGHVLWLNQKAVRALFWLSKSDYEKAVRYLEEKGFISKIVIRGFVPWDPRAKGAYVFVVPRMAKLRAISRASKMVPDPGGKPRSRPVVSRSNESDAGEPAPSGSA